MRLGAVIVLALSVPIAAVASTRTAHVRMLSLSPVSVGGRGFRSHERVTVTVAAQGTRAKTVTATARGTFRATFTGFSIGSCQVYTVRAKGNRGSTAFVRVIPECAPPATPSADVLYPHDPSPRR